MYIPPFPIEPTEVIGGCIAIWRDIWPNPQDTINTIEKITSDDTSKIKFVPAFEIGDNIVQGRRTNYDLSLTNNAQTNEEFRKLNNQFFDLIYSTATAYTRKFAGDSGFHIVEPFNILKYQTGEEYQAHYDGTTKTHRAFSPILYLNDDYTGGELEFVHHNIKLKPTPGMLAIFPSNFAYSHIAHPVKTGTKYAFVTWLHDQPGQ